MTKTAVEIHVDAKELDAALAKVEALVVRTEAASERMERATTVQFHAPEIDEATAIRISEALCGLGRRRGRRD